MYLSITILSLSHFDGAIPSILRAPFTKRTQSLNRAGEKEAHKMKAIYLHEIMIARGAIAKFQVL